MNATFGSEPRAQGDNQLVVEALVVPLQMVMRDVSANNRMKMILSKYNDLVEAFIFYRANKTLRVGVQIGTFGRELYRLHTNRTERRLE